MHGYFTTNGQSRFQANEYSFTQERIEELVFTLIRNEICSIEYYLEPEDDALAKMMMTHITGNTLPSYDDVLALITKRSLLPGLNQSLACEAMAVIAKGGVLMVALGFPGANLVIDKLGSQPINQTGYGLPVGSMNAYTRQVMPCSFTADALIHELMTIAPRQEPWITQAVQDQYHITSHGIDADLRAEIRLNKEVVNILINPSNEGRCWTPQQAEVLSDYIKERLPLDVAFDDFYNGLEEKINCGVQLDPDPWLKSQYETAYALTNYLNSLPLELREVFWTDYDSADNNTKTILLSRIRYLGASKTDPHYIEFRDNIGFIKQFIRKRLVSVLGKLTSKEADDFIMVVSSALMDDITTTTILNLKAINELVRNNLPKHIKESGTIVIIDRVVKTLREVRVLLEIYTDEGSRVSLNDLLEKLKHEVMREYLDNHAVAGLFRKLATYTDI